MPCYNNYLTEGGIVNHNSGKSIAAADYLLLAGVSEKLRILCTREIQKSIKDSVHKLLSDRIEYLGLGSFYDVLETVVRGRNGTAFIFSGLSNQTVTSIKSFAGIDKCWVEEAQTVQKKSWDILIPTIREEGSEFVVTFNPELDSDDTYQRFVVKPPPGSCVVQINWRDNPFFPDVLEQERLHCKATESEEDYNNIWEGMCRSAVVGAIFANEVARAYSERRVTFLPYDPTLKVHVVCDLGFADNMAIGMFQRARSELRCIDYIEVNKFSAHDNGSGYIPGTTDWVCSELKQRRYNFGRVFLPHDAYSEERKTGMSDDQIFRRHGFKTKRIPKTDEETRIKIARGTFPRVAVDQTKCEKLLECLKRYRRPENKHDADRAPIHDFASHGADMFGYACQMVEEMVDDSEIIMPKVPVFTPLSGSMGY